MIEKVLIMRLKRRKKGGKTENFRNLFYFIDWVVLSILC